MGAAQPDMEESDRKAGFIIMMEETFHNRQAPNDCLIVRRTKNCVQICEWQFVENAAGNAFEFSLCSVRS